MLQNFVGITVKGQRNHVVTYDQRSVRDLKLNILHRFALTTKYENHN